MKCYINRDYVENFIKYHKKTIIKVAAGFILFVAAFIVFCIRGYDDNSQEFNLINGVDATIEKNHQTAMNTTVEALDSETTKGAIKEPVKIYVDVGGAVEKPYVYQLNEGVRVYEAIEAAGGLTEEADASNLNLAQILSDQDKLIVSTKKQISEEIKGNSLAANPSSPITNGDVNNSSFGNKNTSTLININTATETELQTITGIGPSTAEKIISYRNDIGQFKKIEELMNVSGIGEKTFAKYKEKITV